MEYMCPPKTYCRIDSNCSQSATQSIQPHMAKVVNVVYLHPPVAMCSMHTLWFI